MGRMKASTTSGMIVPTLTRSHRTSHLSAAVQPAGMSVPLARKLGAAPFAGWATLSFTCGGRCATTSRAFSASAASPGELPTASSCT